MTKSIATEQDAAIMLAVLACEQLIEMEDGEDTLKYLVNSLGYHIDTYLDALDMATNVMDNDIIEDFLKRIISDTIGDVMAKSGKLNQGEYYE